METFIGNLRGYGATLQAVAVTAGGLLGVFITLAAFFLFIFIAVKVSGKGE